MADNKSPYDEVITEVIRKELGNLRRALTALVIVSILLLASLIVNGLLIYELSTYEIVTETAETYDIDTEGDENNVVIGDQYNDNAIHNEGAGE